jgi:hypothetical protein
MKAIEIGISLGEEIGYIYENLGLLYENGKKKIKKRICRLSESSRILPKSNQT